jgi:MFS family permease
MQHARVVAHVLLAVAFWVSPVLAHEGDQTEGLQWTIVVTITATAIMLGFLIAGWISSRRERNPHTKLSRPIRRRRARGPLRRMR